MQHTKEELEERILRVFHFFGKYQVTHFDYHQMWWACQVALTDYAAEILNFSTVLPDDIIEDLKFISKAYTYCSEKGFFNYKEELNDNQ